MERERSGGEDGRRNGEFAQELGQLMGMRVQVNGLF